MGEHSGECGVRGNTRVYIAVLPEGVGSHTVSARQVVEWVHGFTCTLCALSKGAQKVLAKPGNPPTPHHPRQVVHVVHVVPGLTGTL